MTIIIAFKLAVLLHSCLPWGKRSTSTGSPRTVQSEGSHSGSGSSSRSRRPSTCRSSWGCRRICISRGQPRSERWCSRQCVLCWAWWSEERRPNSRARDCRTRSAPKESSLTARCTSKPGQRAAAPSGGGSRHRGHRRSKTNKSISKVFKLGILHVASEYWLIMPEISSCRALTYCTVGFLESHEVNDVGSAWDEEHFHAGVVQADEVHEQVDVSHAEHQQVDLLSLARQSYSKVS